MHKRSSFTPITWLRLFSGGLFVVNVQDPLHPRYEGCYGDDGYTHDAQCLVYRGPDTDYQGREVRSYMAVK